jgi:hypothetical protein
LFHSETKNTKNPINPVDPVYEQKIQTNPFIAPMAAFFEQSLERHAGFYGRRGVSDEPLVVWGILRMLARPEVQLWHKGVADCPFPTHFSSLIRGSIMPFRIRISNRLVVGCPWSVVSCAW